MMEKDSDKLLEKLSRTNLIVMMCCIALYIVIHVGFMSSILVKNSPESLMVVSIIAGIVIYSTAIYWFYGVG